MELVFVTVIGIMIGVIARYAIPGRHTHGLLLLPAVAGAVTAAVWTASVWAGLTFDGGWIWAISIAAAVIASALVAVLLPRRRAASDAALFERLARARA